MGFSIQRNIRNIRELHTVNKPQFSLYHTENDKDRY